MIPSGQLDSKSAIRAAKDSLEKYGRFWLGNEKIESEFYDLDLLTREERYMAIDVALQEVSPACRLGPQPPKVIAKGVFQGNYLYAFRWHSQEFKREMYFKFALSSDAGGTHLAVYSFHESTDKEAPV
ncbi:hypothetical protein SBA4_4800015 [Candidatus Sulfopaludibacter sp. SbA4]|nr:hypothetical protein SBA4_4800015 [Candidatus Sulfopaludibacter sp. SbA4]